MVQRHMLTSPKRRFGHLRPEGSQLRLTRHLCTLPQAQEAEQQLLWHAQGGLVSLLAHQAGPAAVAAVAGAGRVANAPQPALQLQQQPQLRWLQPAAIVSSAPKSAPQPLPGIQQAATFGTPALQPEDAALQPAPALQPELPGKLHVHAVSAAHAISAAAAAPSQDAADLKAAALAAAAANAGGGSGGQAATRLGGPDSRGSMDVNSGSPERQHIDAPPQSPQLHTDVATAAAATPALPHAGTAPAESQPSAATVTPAGKAQAASAADLAISPAGAAAAATLLSMHPPAAGRGADGSPGPGNSPEDHHAQSGIAPRGRNDVAAAAAKGGGPNAAPAGSIGIGNGADTAPAAPNGGGGSPAAAGSLSLAVSTEGMLAGKARQRFRSVNELARSNDPASKVCRPPPALSPFHPQPGIGSTMLAGIFAGTCGCDDSVCCSWS